MLLDSAVYRGLCEQRKTWIFYGVTPKDMDGIVNQFTESPVAESVAILFI